MIKPLFQNFKICFAVKSLYQKCPVLISSMFPLFIEVKTYQEKGYITRRCLCISLWCVVWEWITLQYFLSCRNMKQISPVSAHENSSGKLLFFFTILHFFMFFFNSLTSSLSSHFLIKLNKNQLKMTQNICKCL